MTAGKEMTVTLDKKILIVAGLILILFLFPGIGHGLWGPDEPREAGLCSSMFQHGASLVPHLNGRPFLEKPPLYYVTAAAVGGLLRAGNEMPYRVASLFFSVLTILITFFMVSRRNGTTTGLTAAGILAGSWEFFRVSRWILVDISLVFGVSLAMFAFLELQRKDSARYPVALGLGVGISFLAKGFVGPALIFTAILADLIRTRDIRILSRMRPHIVLAITAASIAPWIGYLNYHGGWPFVREAIVVNNIMRFTGASEGAALGHQHGMLYYLSLFPESFLPWTVLLIPALAWSLREYRDNPYLSWIAGPFVLLSIASTKRGIYLAPLFPAAAALTASWLCSMPRKKWEVVCIRITWLGAFTVCLLPLAGIFYDQILLAVAAAVPGAVLMYLAVRERWVFSQNPLLLVSVMLIGLIMSTTVFFTIMKPREDYLSFARQAALLADGREIYVSGGDELLRGIIPLATGKPCHEVDLHGVPENGLYVWRTRDGNAVPAPLSVSKVRILLERRIGSRQAVLARVLSNESTEISLQDVPSRVPGMKGNISLLR